MADVLVIDDEPGIGLAFSQMMAGLGHACRVAHTVAAAREELARRPPAVIFLDVRLPDGDGLELLPRLAEQVPQARIVVMTAYGSMEVAVEAVRGHAFDYLPKPLRLDAVQRVLEAALADAGEGTFVALDELPSTDGTMAGRSPAIQHVFKMIGVFAGSDVNVLIEGESGVGKEVVARGIHDNSDRADHPFVAINCSAIPESLLESELFGHERGAFTGADRRHVGRFEAAEEGTLFLDEIGDMPLCLQVKILRAIQERCFERVGGGEPIPVRSRIIAATHHDLQEEIEAGRFRQDLYYRLQVASIVLPPLRQRREDIPLLVAHFVRRANRTRHEPIRYIDQALMERLQNARWSGNVRELENVVRRATVMAQGSKLLTHHLTSTRLTDRPVSADDPERAVEHAARTALVDLLAHNDGGDAGTGSSPFWQVVSAAERSVVRVALDIAGGNQVVAAHKLGISRGTLRRKISEYGLGAREGDPGEGAADPR